MNANSAAWVQIFDELSDQVMPIEIPCETASPRNNNGICIHCFCCYLSIDPEMPSFHLFTNYPTQSSADIPSHPESPPAVVTRKMHSPSSDSLDSEGSDGIQHCSSPVNIPNEVEAESDRNTASDQMELFSFPAPKSKRKSYAKSFFR